MISRMFKWNTVNIAGWVLLLTLVFYVIPRSVITSYYEYWPFEPIKIYSVIIKNPNKIVYPGGVLLYELDFDKKMHLAPIVTRQLQNTFVYAMSPATPPIKPLGRQKLTFPIPVPKYAEPGEYQLNLTYAYHIDYSGGKRQINISVSSDKFIVTQPPKGVQ
jgi:hypothetical protein